MTTTKSNYLLFVIAVREESLGTRLSYSNLIP